MRINIHYNLDEKSKNWAYSVNKKISNIMENEIDFIRDNTIPHITLLMGEVDVSSIDKVKKIVSDFKSVCLNNGDGVEFDRPILKGNYIFVEVKENSQFKQDCDNLLAKLDGFIVPHKFLISNGNAPHITLGYVKDHELAEEFIKKIKTVPKSRLIDITISETGTHGTCVKEV